MKTLEKYFKSQGDSVVIVPLIKFKTKARLSERAVLFENYPGSKILNPNEFYEFLGNKFHDETVALIGGIEINHLNSNYAVLIPVTGVSMKTEQGMEKLDDINQLLLNFVCCLWYVKDNCVNIDTGHIFINTDPGLIIHENGIRDYFYDAHSKNETTKEFDYKEIKEASQLAFEAIDLYLDDAKLANKKPTLRIKGQSRIARFSRWVFDARQQHDVLIRIATYITALEALFSTSPAELSHQLSERVALLNPSPRALPAKDAYTRMKTAYGFRSKALHGGGVDEKNQDDLFKMSEFLDELCRQLLHEIMNSKKFESRFETNESIDDFTHEKLFKQGKLSE